jgi:hypothetical protein
MSLTVCNDLFQGGYPYSFFTASYVLPYPYTGELLGQGQVLGFVSLETGTQQMPDTVE